MAASPRPGPVNSFRATRPSVLAPMSMTATSFSIATTWPFTTEPSLISDSRKDSSSRAAKSSRLGACWYAADIESPVWPHGATPAARVNGPLPPAAAGDAPRGPDPRHAAPRGAGRRIVDGWKRLLARRSAARTRHEGTRSAHPGQQSSNASSDGGYLVQFPRLYKRVQVRDAEPW